MLTAADETYESLLPFAETIDLEGVPIRTINLEGLLRTKTGARPKDEVDRAVLEAALGKRR